ncbi:PKD domain-containing protein, partial [Arthrobacter sp. 2RAF6]|uniref:PKD domain-containing protein n=1 Tax=Arthrobacter sp. 2RAF6 TaxID=3233002 RepID=UPI003F93BCD6
MTIDPNLFKTFVTWLAARTANGTTSVQTVAQTLGNVPNQPPVAAFTSSTTGLTATFDGSTSTDPNGTVASYGWDFGDGSPAGTGVKPSHTYAAAGTYQVKLTVTDKSGLTGTVTHAVTVAAAATAPAAPTGVTATAGNASVVVSWTAPANGGSAITSYAVTPSSGGTALAPVTVSGSPPSTTATVTGLTNGTAYTFTVTASNAVGTSAPSAASAPVTPAAPAPGVTNGGFESGLASWTTGGVRAPVPSTAAHTGTGSALLGLASGAEPLGDSNLAQTITMPAAGTSTLSFWYQPHTADDTCTGTT